MTTPECPQCCSHDCVQVSDQQAECLECGEVFIHPAETEEEELVA